MRRTLPPSHYGPGHPDFPVLDPIERVILSAVPRQNLGPAVGVMLRQAIDVVIDTPVTARCDYEELEKTEKTYLGTRVEIHLRSLLGVKRGVRLDLAIAGGEADVKFTVGSNWMIPREAIGKPCVLVAADEERAVCYLGLFLAREDYLHQGNNQDKKKSLSAIGFANIQWLVREEPYPPNFWRAVDANTRAAILGLRSGNARIAALFEIMLRVPIHRSVIDDVARQRDASRRVRTGGGARDELLGKGIVVLSGKYDAAEISRRGLPKCDTNSWISDQA